MSTQTDSLLAGHPPGDWRILVIEDAPTMKLLVQAVLGNRGLEVQLAGDGRSGLELVDSWHPDLVVLDLGLPDLDGMEVCQRIRETSDAFVVMLTGRDDDASRVDGLRIGADTYITKPFDNEELLLAIEVLLRRSAPTGGLAERFDLGPLTVDRSLRQVMVHGETVHLTKIEFTVLEKLAAAGGAVVTREDLVTMLWGPHWVGDDHVISVHMANLRKKVDPEGTGLFETIRGVGYRVVI